MLFNTVEFAVFLPVVFVLYWFVFKKNLRGQNVLLLVASYFFYGWWDWRFLFLLAFSSTVDYFIGIALSQSTAPQRRKWLVGASLVVNLGLLGFFKYYNFFAESFADAFTLLGQPFEVSRLHIILPVGISFYTFQTLSYTLDIYRGRLEPTRDPLAFFGFVSFFPQLVAGPIERASQLLPQFHRERVFHYPDAVNGLRQILWGLFKKIVIADNAASYINDVYASPEDGSGSSLLFTTLLFAFQIYGDFSGYSDIAIGSARLFGFSLMRNFAFPYFSRDIAEFWRRWHISLSTWFRDYLYIPLGGSRTTRLLQVRNVFVVFLVSGFWHGANWTFILWGALHASFFLPLLLLNRNRANLDVIAQNRWLPSLREAVGWGFTFALVVLAWVPFRAQSIEHTWLIYGKIFSPSVLIFPGVTFLKLFVPIVGLLIMEWIERRQEFVLCNLGERLPWLPLRWGIYLLLGACIFLTYESDLELDFIYFQF